jgi:hypothetical protein
MRKLVLFSSLLLCNASMAYDPAVADNASACSVHITKKYQSGYTADTLCDSNYLRQYQELEGSFDLASLRAVSFFTQKGFSSSCSDFSDGGNWVATVCRFTRVSRQP